MTLEGELAVIMVQGIKSTIDVAKRQMAVKNMHSSSIPKIQNKCRDIPDVLHTRHQR